MLSYRIENDGTVQCHINCKAYTFGRDHKCYDKLIAAIRAYDEGDLSAAAEIPKLINITWAVEDYVSESEDLKVVRGQLFFQGVLIQHFSFVDRLLKQMEMDLPVDRLVKFIERLLKNPNAYHIADALFEFFYGPGCLALIEIVPHVLPQVRVTAISPAGRFVAEEIGDSGRIAMQVPGYSHRECHVVHNDFERSFPPGVPGDAIKRSTRECADPNLEVAGM